MGDATAALLSDAMPTAEETEPEAFAWSVVAEPAPATAPVKRPSRARLAEQRAKSASAIVASGLCLVLMAAAVLVGGRTTIGPLLTATFAAREVNGVGDVVFAMPDGEYCRRMAFDNVTAEITEHALERCPSGVAKRVSRASRGFAWSAH